MDVTVGQTERTYGQTDIQGEVFIRFGFKATGTGRNVRVRLGRRQRLYVLVADIHFSRYLEQGLEVPY